MSQTRHGVDVPCNPTDDRQGSLPVLEFVKKRALRTVLRDDSSDPPTGIIRCSEERRALRLKAVLMLLLDHKNILCSDILLIAKTRQERCAGELDTLLLPGDAAVLVPTLVIVPFNVQF